MHQLDRLRVRYSSSLLQKEPQIYLPILHVPFPTAQNKAYPETESEDPARRIQMRSTRLYASILWLILGSERGEVGGQCICLSPNPNDCERKKNDEQLICFDGWNCGRLGEGISLPRECRIHRI